jgi:hypothetical protein
MKQLMLVLTLAIAGLQTRAAANPNDTLLVYKGNVSSIAVGDNLTDKSQRGVYVIIGRDKQEAEIISFYKLGPKKFYHDFGKFDIHSRNIEADNSKVYAMFDHQSQSSQAFVLNDFAVYFFGKEGQATIDNSGFQFAVAPTLTGVLRNFSQASILDPALYVQQNFTVTLNLPLTMNSNNASQLVAAAANTIRAILTNKGYNAD